MASDTDEKITLNHVEARQGSRKPNLVYVLGAGLLMVIVVFAIVWTTQH